MTDAAANQPTHPRWWLRLLVLILAVVGSFLTITAIQVVHTASLQELHPADAIVIFASLLFLLMISAMTMAVGFATRGAMAGNREIIEVLHFVGAADSYISRQFQAHFLRLGLRGGLIGGALAALFFAGASILSAWWTSSVGGEEIGALFGAFSLGPKGYGAILAVAVAIAVLTGAISRIIVFRHLRRLQ